jgi:hypothetical protein
VPDGLKAKNADVCMSTPAHQRDEAALQQFLAG